MSAFTFTIFLGFRWYAIHQLYSYMLENVHPINWLSPWCPGPWGHHPLVRSRSLEAKIRSRPGRISEKNISEAICLFMCIFTYLSIYPSTSSSIWTCIYISTYLSTYLTVDLSNCYVPIFSYVYSRMNLNVYLRISIHPCVRKYNYTSPEGMLTWVKYSDIMFLSHSTHLMPIWTTSAIQFSAS